MTKENKQIIDSYNRATASELWEVYGRFSHAKQNAMDYCKRKQYEHHGHAGRILSANTFIFTYCFRVDNENESYLYYITPSREKKIALVED